MARTNIAHWLLATMIVFLATSPAPAQTKRTVAASNRTVGMAEKGLYGVWDRYFDKSKKPIKYFTLANKSIILHEPVERKSAWALSDGTISAEFAIEGQYTIKIEWKILDQKADYLKVLQTWSGTDTSVDTLELFRNAKERPDSLAGLKILRGHASAVKTARFSPDGKRVISGSDDRLVLIWDIESGLMTVRLTGHVAGVNSVAFSPDGKYAISGSSDFTYKHWDVSSEKEIRSKNMLSSVNSVCFSPDGRHAALGLKGKQVALLELSTGKEVNTLSGHESEVASVCWSKDGKHVLSGSYDKTWRLWDAAAGKLLKTVSLDPWGGHGAILVKSVCFSKDGRYALSGSSDREVNLWALDSLKRLKDFTGHTAGINSVCFSPDGKFVLSGSDDGTVRLWDAASGNEIKKYASQAPYVYAVDISPDGRLALSAQGNTIRIWEISEAGR